MSKLRMTLMTSLTVLSASPAAASPTDTRNALPADIRGLIQRADAQTMVELAKSNLGGATLGIVFDGRLVWTRSYGWADRARRIPASAATIYRVGSVTKLFTALMLLQLEEAGTVHLSDPVERHYPEVAGLRGRPPGAAPITLAQLATHTSGLAPEPQHATRYLSGPVSDWEKVMLSALPETEYQFEPGTRFGYSNIGYAILGAALARAAGKPYVPYVRERIFRPLGMKDTDFEPRRAMRRRLATGYVLDHGAVDSLTSEREHRGRGYKVPNGAAYSTVADLARFVAFELGAGPDSVLRGDRLRENLRRTIVASDDDMTAGYGVGFQVERAGNVLLYGHNGGVAGYRADVFFEPRSRTGFILLHNAQGDGFGGLDVLRAAYSEPLHSPAGP
jgi:CubicO group peptidase (beta-lactamase class C family)